MNSLSKVKVKRDEKNCYSKASFTGARGKTPMFKRGKFLKFYLKVIKKHPPAVGGTNRKKIPSVEGSEFLSLLIFTLNSAVPLLVAMCWSCWLLFLCSSIPRKKRLKKPRLLLCLWANDVVQIRFVNFGSVCFFANIGNSLAVPRLRFVRSYIGAITASLRFKHHKWQRSVLSRKEVVLPISIAPVKVTFYCH